MNARFEKTVVTLGEMIARRTRELMKARTVRIEWLDLLQRLTQRSAALPAPERFERVDHRAAQKPAAAIAERADEAPEEEGAILPADTRERLRPDFGAAIDAMRVHDDERADRLSSHHHADAVTIGRDVYFRQGAFQPRERRGLALIAHEAAHVLESTKPNAAWQRSTLAGAVEEERHAARRERAALNPERRPAGAPPADRRAVAPMPALAPAPSPEARPMKADTDRPLLSEPASPRPTADALEDMKRALYRDIMDRIRTDFERGA